MNVNSLGNTRRQSSQHNNRNAQAVSSGKTNGVLDEFLNPSSAPRSTDEGRYPSQSPDSKVSGNETSGDSGGGGECYSEHGGDLRMLDLRQANGSFTALPYHYLETVDFVPSEGIVLTYPMCKVKISGYRLHVLYQGLLGFRIGFIQALGNHFMPSPSPPPPPPEAPEVTTRGSGVPGVAYDEDGEPAVEGITIEMAAGR